MTMALSFVICHLLNESVRFEMENGVSDMCTILFVRITFEFQCGFI